MLFPFVCMVERFKTCFEYSCWSTFTSCQWLPFVFCCNFKFSTCAVLVTFEQLCQTMLLYCNQTMREYCLFLEDVILDWSACRSLVTYTSLLKSVIQGNSSTLSLEVFTQRNLVADVIRLNLNFIYKKKTIRSVSHPLGQLGITYNTADILILIHERATTLVF